MLYKRFIHPIPCYSIQIFALCFRYNRFNMRYLPTLLLVRKSFCPKVAGSMNAPCLYAVRFYRLPGADVFWQCSWSVWSRGLDHVLQGKGKILPSSAEGILRRVLSMGRGVAELNGSGSLTYYMANICIDTRDSAVSYEYSFNTHEVDMHMYPVLPI